MLTPKPDGTVGTHSVSIARWFRDDGPLSADEVASQYTDFALRIVGVSSH